MRIYVASSWRNKYQPEVVRTLAEEGHAVYDFRHPPTPKGCGFSWSEIDPNWEKWTRQQYAAALQHPIAVAGYRADIQGVRQADLGVLVLPSGRSASFEAGAMFGMGKPVLVYMPEVCEPELMYQECKIMTDLGELVSEVRHQANRHFIWTGVR